jgi:hypothetical protein
MIKIGLGSIYFAARNAGSAGSPATLTITFGEGIETSLEFFVLIINGIQYKENYIGPDLPISTGYYDEESRFNPYSAEQVASSFQTYIATTFSSSLTVSRTNNVVTLTTKATGPTANLNASCVLPIFPTVPLGTQVNITLRKTSGFASSYPDNYKLYSGGTLLYNSDWDYTADLVWSNVTVSTTNTLTIVTTLSEVEQNNPYISSLTNNTCGAVINKSLPYGPNDSEPFNLTSFTSNGNVQINFGANYSP